MQDLDFSAKLCHERQQVLQLVQTTWITKALNLIILGPTGSGKTFLACALGRAACQHDLVVASFVYRAFFSKSKLCRWKENIPAFTNLSSQPTY